MSNPKCRPMQNIMQPMVMHQNEHGNHISATLALWDEQHGVTAAKPDVQKLTSDQHRWFTSGYSHTVPDVYVIWLFHMCVNVPVTGLAEAVMWLLSCVCRNEMGFAPVCRCCCHDGLCQRISLPLITVVNKLLRGSAWHMSILVWLRMRLCVLLMSSVLNPEAAGERQHD